MICTCIGWYFLALVYLHSEFHDFDNISVKCAIPTYMFAYIRICTYTPVYTMKHVSFGPHLIQQIMVSGRQCSSQHYDPEVSILYNIILCVCTLYCMFIVYTRTQK